MIGAALVFMAIGARIVPHVACYPLEVSLDLEDILDVPLRNLSDVVNAMGTRASVRLIPRKEKA